MKWDVFISHAFEDKAYTRQLATALHRKGLKVWFDEFELKTGDGLTRTIDHGLSESKYGIVVLSPNFFAKEWTQKELGALTSRESRGEKIILPIWHNITQKQVEKYSPMLADRVAIISETDIEETVETLYSIISGAKIRTYLEVDLEISKKLLRNKQIEMEAVLEEAQFVASIDPLTKINDRRVILSELKSYIAKSSIDKSRLSILMLDLDNFKEINDKHGHLIGDLILQIIAQRLKDSIKKPNIIGRYGGDEFLVLMPNSSVEQEIEQAELLCRQFELTPIIHGDFQFIINISIGISSYNPEEDWTILLSRADKALYQSKEQGGNKWSLL